MGAAWEAEGSLLAVVSTSFAQDRGCGAGSRAHLRELMVPRGARLASQQGVVLQLLWESLPREGPGVLEWPLRPGSESRGSLS